MKHLANTLLYIVALLLAMPLTAQAQQKATQDALYIFRNDGVFHAFFYGDIDHFEYSKVDTLGVEQPDYCVQEVHALDSVFRIPLSAIDSVAFVTPETKYTAEAVIPDKSLLGYVVASDSMTWFRVKAETPSTLLPKVGDKLLIEETCELLPYGFAAKVTSLKSGTAGITVETEPIPLTDVYEQLVYKTPNYSASNARTRGLESDPGFHIADSIVGTRKLDVSGPYAAEQNIGPLKTVLGGEIQASYEYHDFVELNYQEFLHVSIFTGVNSDSHLRGRMSSNSKTTIEAALQQNFDVMLKGFKSIDGMTEIGVGIFGQLSASMVGEWTYKDDVSFIGEGHLNYGNPFKPVDADVQFTSKVNSEEKTFKLKLGTVSTAMGVYAKAETRFRSHVIGLRAELGAQVSFSYPVELNNLLDTPMPIKGDIEVYPPRTYDALNQTSTLESHGFVNGQFYYSLGKKTDTGQKDKDGNPIEKGGNWANTHKWETKFLEFDKQFGMIPSVQHVSSQSVKNHPEQIEVSTLLGNPPFDATMAAKVGYLTLDKHKNLIDSYFWSEYNGSSWSTYRYNLDMLDTDSTYVVYPLIRQFDMNMIASDSVEVTLGPKRYEVERQLFPYRSGGIEQLDVDTNIKNIEYKPKVDWLKATDLIAYEDQGRQVSVQIDEMPAETYDRRGRIDVVGKNRAGDVILEDSIIVVQSEMLLEFSPEKIEADVKGGTYTINITKTNLTDLTVASDEDFCKATLSGNTITVVVSENTTTDERFAKIIIKGTTIDGKQQQDYATVTQLAAKNDNKRTQMQKIFCGKWKLMQWRGEDCDVEHFNETMTINDDFTFERKNVCISETSESFTHYEVGEVKEYIHYGKIEIPDISDWQEIPNVSNGYYMKKYGYLQDYDKAFFKNYKLTNRTYADPMYGKWLTDEDNSGSVSFHMSPDYKYIVTSNEYLWQKIDENHPSYTDPTLLFEDPRYLHLSDPISMVNRGDCFEVKEESRFLTDVKATTGDSFIYSINVENLSGDLYVFYSCYENDSKEERIGYITVEGTWPDGTIGSATFTVKQDGKR